MPDDRDYRFEVVNGPDGEPALARVPAAPTSAEDRGPLDLAACRADIERAHTEVGDIAHDGYRRWRMSIPAQPDRDSDLLISAGLAHGERLADEVERLRAELDRVIQGRTQAQLERNAERQRAETAEANLAVAVQRAGQARAGADRQVAEIRDATEAEVEQLRVGLAEDRATIERVRLLHSPGVMPDMCKECCHVPAADCPTLRALETQH